MTDAEHKLAVIAASFKEHGMFHTPKSKEEATSWCELQGAQNHMATVGFMVGLNYAAEMIKQIMDGTHPGLTPTFDPDAEVPIPAHDATPVLETTDIPADAIETGDPDDA